MEKASKKIDFELDGKLGEIMEVAEKIGAIGGVMYYVGMGEYWMINKGKRTIFDELAPNYGEMLINANKEIAEIVKRIQIQEAPETETPQE